jgi:hypothetical protein
MRKQYVVRLSKQERKELQALTRRGHLSARKLLHAQVLLKVDQAKQGPAWTDAQVAEFLAVGTSMIEQVRKRFCQEGLRAAREPLPGWGRAGPSGGVGLLEGPRWLRALDVAVAGRSDGRVALRRARVL